MLVFTTNLGVDAVVRALADAGDRAADPAVRDRIARAVLHANGIAPELVGRLHELLVFDPLAPEHLDAILRRSIEREAATFDLEVRAVGSEIVDALRRRAPDPGSGARAWEHLISTDVGPAFLAARRNRLIGPVALSGSPVTVTSFDA